jgi:hypothetical protein
MAVQRMRLQIVIALLVAGVIAGGCGPYKTFRGKPRDFATHPFRVTYPAGWLISELPKMRHELLIVAVFSENIAVSPNQPASPAMIFVRAYPMRPNETVVTFMDRYYDYLAPTCLDIKLRKLGRQQGAEAWEVTAAGGNLQAKVFVLPREKLAYEIAAAGTPEQHRRFAKQFQKALDTFRLLPARR